MLPFIFYLSLFLPAAVLGKDYFTAAVFEHRLQLRNAVDTKEPMEVKTANLQYFSKAVEVAAQKGADIILFNEYGTYMVKSRKELMNYAEYVPDPKLQKFNPCVENAKDRVILYSLSCFARENNIYIVGNLVGSDPCEATCDADEIENCEAKCPDDGVFFYNTDVAFDRKGNLIARYRKVHPYYGEIVNAPEPEFSVFETEFGKFGMIVCFDLVYKEAVLLKDKYGIDTLLFPTYWFDDILPLNAVEFQQAWAIENRVNVLSSNTHAPSSGSMGSGIFSKDDGALVYTYEPDGKSKLLLANIRIKGDSEIPNVSTSIEITPNSAFPTTETGEKFPDNCYDKVVGPAEDDEIDYRCLKLKLKNYSLTKLEQPSGEVKACNNDLCCTLSYETQNLQDEYYLAVYNGFGDAFNYFYWWEEVCVLTRCDPYEGKPCVLQPSRSKTVFQKIELKGNFKSKRVYPSVSTSNNRLAPKREWGHEKIEGEIVLTYQSRSDLPLLKAALFGRSYERDQEFVPYYPTQAKKDDRE